MPTHFVSAGSFECADHHPRTRGSCGWGLPTTIPSMEVTLIMTSSVNALSTCYCTVGRRSHSFHSCSLSFRTPLGSQPKSFSSLHPFFHVFDIGPKTPSFPHTPISSHPPNHQFHERSHGHHTRNKSRYLHAKHLMAAFSAIACFLLQTESATKSPSPSRREKLRKRIAMRTKNAIGGCLTGRTRSHLPHGPSEQAGPH